jgi:hypothetical protein
MNISLYLFILVLVVARKLRICVFGRDFLEHGMEEHIDGRIGFDQVLEVPDDGKEWRWVSGDVFDHLLNPSLDETSVSGEPSAMTGNSECLGDILGGSGEKDNSGGELLSCQ